MSDQRPVVVGLDGSTAGLTVVGFAAAEALRRRATLEITHVWPGRYPRPYSTGGLVPTRDDGRRLLEVAAARAELAAPGSSVRTELLEGAAGVVLVSASDHARLIVVGHRAGFTCPSWGSTSAYLAHHSSCPVLIFRGSTRPGGPVVAAVSARPGATSTIEYAFSEAAELGSRLVAVHVWGLDDPPVAAPNVPMRAFVAERREAERLLAEVLAGRSGDYPDVPIERVLIQDSDIAYTVARASRRACRLVGGMGNTSLFAGLIYGSHNIGSSRRCPVLLVPAGWPARSASGDRAGQSPDGSRTSASWRRAVGVPAVP